MINVLLMAFFTWFCSKIVGYQEKHHRSHGVFGLGMIVFGLLTIVAFLDLFK